MTQPQPEHISIPVEQVQACADLAAQLYLAASSLVIKARHSGQALAEIPPQMAGNVYDLSVWRDQIDART